jgi:hypothetical protein
VRGPRAQLIRIGSDIASWINDRKQVRRDTATVLAALLPIVAGACGWFDDSTPENVRFRLSSTAGTQVDIVYCTQFVAAVDEAGVTHASLFRADTVRQALPVDTTLFIGIDRRFFVEVLPADTLTVDVRVDVDDWNQISERGLVRASDPWRYVYLFNERVTRIIDTVP